MASLDIETVHGFVDKRRGRGALTDSQTSPANQNDVGAMRTRLFAISATAYSVANLDKMTKNDMVLAIRQADEAAGLA